MRNNTIFRLSIVVILTTWAVLGAAVTVFDPPQAMVCLAPD